MPKSPTCCSLFEKSKEIWIALNSQNQRSIEIRRASIIAFNETNIPFHSSIIYNASSIISREGAASHARSAIWSFSFGHQKTSHHLSIQTFEHSNIQRWLPPQYSSSYSGAQVVIFGNLDNPLIWSGNRITSIVCRNSRPCIFLAEILSKSRLSPSYSLDLNPFVFFLGVQNGEEISSEA